MPEYVYPGVYVEELGAGIRPIPPVPLDDEALKSIAAELRRAVAAYAPEWTSTGSNESDPGITLLELFAFLGESLRFRSTGACSGAVVTRPVFFAGRLLDVAALSQEQDYQREKRRRHNLALIGSGIVSGLGVEIVPDSGPGGPRVAVEPGYAIDPRGEELSVPCPVTLALTLPQGDAAFVTIRYWERPCAPAPAAGDAGLGAASTIEEACVLGTAAEVVSPALGLARLVRGETGWYVDPAYRVPRIQ
jgi:hypothetical protein